MRELARLLTHLKSKCTGNIWSPNVQVIHDFIKPEHYSTVISSVQEISGFNPLNGSLKILSLATKIVHSLKTCADIIQCAGISKNDEKLEQSAKSFKLWWMSSGNMTSSGNASRTLYKAEACLYGSSWVEIQKHKLMNPF